MMTTICSEDLFKSEYFYTTLFDFDVTFTSDWFIQLQSKDKQFELGIIDKTNALVPPYYQGEPKGFYMTFVVDDVDAIFELAKQEYFTIVSEPDDTFYGQRRLLLQDPNGALIDVSSLIKS